MRTVAKEIYLLISKRGIVATKDRKKKKKNLATDYSDYTDLGKREDDFHNHRCTPMHTDEH